MKTISVYRKTLSALLAIGFLSCVMLFASCDKDKNDTNNPAQMYTTTGNASGSQENPPVTTTGSGTLTGTYNTSTNVWQYNINWSSLTSDATAVELHGPADAGISGTLIMALSITTSGVTGNASGNITLTEQQETDLLAGRYYYTVLTATNLTGEIRGQITTTVQ